MSGGRHFFSREFKEQMVELYLQQEGQKSVSQVARENGVGTETLRSWVKKYRADHPVEESPLTVSERARLSELEREVRELRLEKEFLGKGVPRTLALSL